MIKRIINFYKWFSDNQLLKTKEQHHILVGCLLTFALCLNIFMIPTKLLSFISAIIYIRLIDIHLHNMNVAFFDHYQYLQGMWHPVQHISSYKRIFILNILVTIELLLYLRVIIKAFNHNIIMIILLILAIIPTLILFIRCFDYKLEKYFGNSSN